MQLEGFLALDPLRSFIMAQSIFSFVDHEVFAITANHGGQQSGSIATWVLPSSIQDGYPECMVLSAPQNYTHELMLGSGRFVLHLLAKSQARHLLALGIESGRDLDKLSLVPHTLNGKGDVILDGVSAYRVCTVVQTMRLSERVAVIGRVEHEQLFSQRLPLSKKAAFAALSSEERQKLHDKQKQVADKSIKT